MLGNGRPARPSHFSERGRPSAWPELDAAGALAPAGVGVVIEAEHTCMTIRGVRAAGSTTVTSTLLGTLRADPRSRQEFFTLTRGAA